MNLLGEYKNNLEFLETVKKFLENFQDKNIILWGNGRLLNTFLKNIDNLNIKFIVDKDKSLWNTYINNYKVLSPETLKYEDKETTKIISLMYDSQHISIYKYLEEIGFDEKSYCLASDYLIASNFFYKDKIILPNFELVITSVCTLKCAHCIAKLPYSNNKPSHIPFEDVKENIDNIFKTIDYIDMFQFATGEVILHKDLIKILRYLYENYKNRYNQLTFVTSGTAIPNEKIFIDLQKYIGFIQISPYDHPDVQKYSKLDTLKNLLNKYKIKYKISRYATGSSGKLEWNDIGSLTQDLNRTFDENKNLYNSCSMKICRSMVNNKIFPCTVACYAHYGEINDIKLDKKYLDYIDILSTKVDLAMFFLNATTKGYPNMCNYCNGVGEEVNSKLVVAAEQVKQSKK